MLVQAMPVCNMGCYMPMPREVYPSMVKVAGTDNASMQSVMLPAYAPVKYALQRINMLAQTMRVCNM